MTLAYLCTLLIKLHDMLKNKLLQRILTFGIGLFVMSFGVALSVKANLGVSPISCIPYVFSFKLPFTLGELTIVFNIILIAAQMGILRKNYKLIQLIQLPVVFAFGIFIDFSMSLITNLWVANYALQTLWCLLSCIIIAFGVFLEVKANITYLPGEGLAMAITDTFNKEFGKTKIAVDSSMVVVGAISALIIFHQLQGIREGTIVAAISVGFIAKLFKNNIQFIDSFLNINTTAPTITSPKPRTAKKIFYITISREFGSGGHEIGKRLAEQLGISFYDKNLIELTAKQSGLPPDFIKQNEQKLDHALVFELYQQNYAYVNNKKAPLDLLFLVQSKIIRDICEKESCVIIGRCANFILKDNPYGINIFIHADKKYREERIAEEYKAPIEDTKHLLEKIDKERANYCSHYTGRQWKDATNYDITINSSQYQTDEAINIIKKAIIHLTDTRTN